jgi:hypothetical protein
MVISVRITDNGLTHVSRSIKGENTHVNLLSVKTNQGAKVLHHRQLQRVSIELAAGRKVDQAAYQLAERKAYRAAKKQLTSVSLEVGQILARQ